jgi:hypothetical protein
MLNVTDDQKKQMFSKTRRAGNDEAAALQQMRESWKSYHEKENQRKI